MKHNTVVIYAMQQFQTVLVKLQELMTFHENIFQNAFFFFNAKFLWFLLGSDLWIVEMESP